jgi:hypothetical protein
MESKMHSLRDNRLKSSTSNKRNRMEFFDETKIQRSYVQFTKIVKISPPCSDNPIKFKEFRS